MKTRITNSMGLPGVDNAIAILKSHGIEVYLDLDCHGYTLVDDTQEIRGLSTFELIAYAEGLS